MKRISKYKYHLLVLAIAIISALFISGAMTGFSIVSNSEDLVSIKTNYGEIIVELYPEKAPITVENFKSYAEEGFYDGTIFHRVINDFMIQGGGYTTSEEAKQTKDSIVLESDNGLSNEKYTIAMARTNSPNSATSQFFINTKDNDFLDYSSQSDGYAVFGKVIKGQNVVEKIESVETKSKSIYVKDWPVEDVIIESVDLMWESNIFSI